MDASKAEAGVQGVKVALVALGLRAWTGADGPSVVRVAATDGSVQAAEAVRRGVLGRGLRARCVVMALQEVKWADRQPVGPTPGREPSSRQSPRSRGAGDDRRASHQHRADFSSRDFRLCQPGVAAPMLTR